MRVIAGLAKGRRLRPVPGVTTRPILDRVKTALFDTINPHLENTRFLDLFAGSGAVGIEALSRGASYALFNDLEPAAIQTIRENLDETGFTSKAHIRRTDAFTLIRKLESPFDIIYVAPPQYEGLWVEALVAIAERPDLLTEDGMVIVQIDPKEFEETSFLTLAFEKEKRIGNTLLLWWRKSSSSLSQQ